MLTRKHSSVADAMAPFFGDGARRNSLQNMALGTFCLAALSVGVVDGARAQDGLEEIMVTGSRLRRDGMSTPTPVTALGSDEMRAMAPTLLMDSLVQLPQFRNNQLSHTGTIFDTGGTNSVNLRGIGSNRTLTLLDGRRVVGGSQLGTVDIAILPTALIERVEVVTGGASAAYGSDAISGVTNFILNTDYVGYSAHVQTGTTSRRDHDHYQVEFAGGMPIGERTHIIASVDYYEADPLVGYDGRDWFQSWALFTDLTATPQRWVDRPGRSRGVTPGGIIPSGPLAGTQFIDGVPSQIGTGNPIVGNTQVGGGGVDPAQQWGILRPGDKRRSVFAHLSYDFSDDMKGYVQYLKGHHAVETPPQPTGFAVPWATFLYGDNPYLPDSIVQRMDDAGLARVPYARLWEDFAAARTVEDDTTSITLGFDGQIGRMFLSSYYQYGENVELADYSSNGLLVRTDRFYRALDAAVDPATGQVMCRANIPAFGGLTPEEEAAISRISSLGQVIHGDPESNRGCVPIDPFAKNQSQAVIDYVTGGVHHKQTIKQHVFDVTLQTQLAEGRAQGPISIGGGLAYREESVYQDAFGNASDPRRMADFGVFSEELNPDDRIPIRGIPPFIRDRGVFYTGNPNNEGPIVGEFDVWEVFAESIVPVVRGAGGSAVDLHLATRYANYSGSGGVWAGKIGADWQINDQVRLRATWSQDTRAGTLSERFDTQTAGANITDPLVPELSPYIAATTVGGNPNVDPELSETVTAGIVYQPSWADGLSLSVDVYDIKIKDAIGQLGAQEIIDRCHDDGIAEACALITRSAVGEPTISEIFNLYINIAEATTKGVDFEAVYRRPINLLGGGSESIVFRAFVNYLDEVTSQLAGAPKVNLAGQMTGMNPPGAEWLGTASIGYARGPFRVNWQTRYIGSGVRNVEWVDGIHIENNKVSSRKYTNLNLSFDFDWTGGNGEAYFFVGNLFDKEPPLVPLAIGGTTGFTTHTSNAIFDTLGRTFSAGVRFGFGN